MVLIGDSCSVSENHHNSARKDICDVPYIPMYPLCRSSSMIMSSRLQNLQCTKKFFPCFLHQGVQRQMCSHCFTFFLNVVLLYSYSISYINIYMQISTQYWGMTSLEPILGSTGKGRETLNRDFSPLQKTQSHNKGNLKTCNKDILCRRKTECTRR